jgi:tripartite-type tricarboxylate transporter receptor subunit TctC
MKIHRYFLRLLAMAVTTGLLIHAPAWSQASASNNTVIRLIVPYGAGGPIDVTARVLAEKLKDIGTIIVENKPGAGGNIGVDLVAKAAPDGHTIGIAAVATHAINPWLFSKMPFDVAKDFAPYQSMGACAKCVGDEC